MMSGTTIRGRVDGSGMPSMPIINRSPGVQARKVSALPRAFTLGSASRAPFAASACISGSGSISFLIGE